MKPREALAGPWLAGLSAWRAIAGGPPKGAFRILLMHDVPASHHARLGALLDHVARSGGFISPGEALARIENPEAGAADSRVPCLVTFDDGFASNRAAAEIVLAPRGIRAVFFVCPGLIDLAPEAQRDAVAARIVAGGPMPEPRQDGRALMDWDDLAALAAAGHAIGAHTLTHGRLTATDDAELKREVAGAGTRIAEQLGAAPDWFAFPFGDVGSVDAYALAVAARHYRACRSGVRGVNLPGQHRLALHADHVDLDASFAWQRLVVAGGLDGRYRGARARLDRMAREASQSAAA